LKFASSSLVLVQVAAQFAFGHTWPCGGASPDQQQAMKHASAFMANTTWFLTVARILAYLLPFLLQPAHR
jgi:hypothetical protein